MSEFYDEKGNVLGHFVDGKPVFIQQAVPAIMPAPTGDELDDLVLSCSRAILTRSKLREKVNGKDRIHGDLTRDQETPSHVLLEAIQAWIQQGNLRDLTQVNRAVTEFIHWATRLTELGVFTRGLNGSPEWTFDRVALKRLGYFFGMSGIEPLPSKAEILAERERFAREDAEYQTKMAAQRREDAAKMAEYEVEFAKQERIKTLTNEIAAKLWSFEQIDFDVEPLPPEYDIRLRKRQNFKKFSTDEIKGLVEAGKSNAEIIEGMIMSTIDSLRQVNRTCVEPLEAGQTRQYFTKSEWARFMASDAFAAIHETNRSHFMLGMDGLYVLTLGPKTPLTEVEQAALAAHAAKSDETRAHAA
jgi:hypothetical protein